MHAKYEGGQKISIPTFLDSYRDLLSTTKHQERLTLTLRCFVFTRWLLELFDLNSTEIHDDFYLCPPYLL